MFCKEFEFLKDSCVKIWPDIQQLQVVCDKSCK